MIVRRYFQYRQNFNNLIIFHLNKRNYSFKNDFVHSKAPNINLTRSLIHEHIWCSIEKWPEKTAVICGETGRSYTFKEFYLKSKSLANFLRRSLKLETHDTVAIMMPNVPEYLIAIFGCLTGGIKATLVNPMYTQEEIAKQLISSEAKLIITLNDLYDLCRKSTTTLNKRSNIPIITVNHQEHQSTPEGAINFHEICNKTPPDNLNIAIDHDDVAMLPYSSGTTGKPKGVELTHYSIVSNICQMLDNNFTLFEETTNNHQDVVPCVLPLFHIYGLNVILLNTLFTGCKAITLSKFTSANFIKILEEYPPHVLYLVPPIILMLLNNKNIKLSHFENVRTLMSSAAPLGAADIERFHDKTRGNINFLQMYGLTEASPLILCQSKTLNGGIKIGGSGMLVPNTKAKIVDIDDPNNKNLGPNKSGELIISGPQIMKGYYKNVESTRATIVDDGWLRTGDIAHYDEDGQFYITDRLKELIKVKGFQVAPAELEEILRDNPNVADAAVVGVNHQKFGEVPKAYVVLKSHASIKSEELAEYVATKVAPYKKLLGGVTFLDNIPKTKTGKILRKELKSLNLKHS